MQRKAKSSVVITLIFLGGLAGVFTFEPKSVKAVFQHETISISGNENFTAANGVTGGNGTILDPFVISEWSINTDLNHGIVIRNTTEYFVIRNVTINSSSDSKYNGINFENVKNGNIFNVTLNRNLNGIRIMQSEKVTVSDSSCSDNTEFGIEILYSSNVSILNNDVMKNFRGCRLFHSENNYLSGNDISNNSHRGIVLDSSDSNNMTNNNIQSNFGNGIYLSNGSNGNTVYSNIVMNNTGGIYCSDSDYNHLMFNIIKYNLNAGMAIHSSSNNIFKQNKLDDNNWGGIDVSGSYKNEISFNEFLSAYNVAISLYNSIDNIIRSNYVARRYEGITIYNSPGSLLTDNRLEFSGISISGDPSKMELVTIDTSNTVNSQPVYFWKNRVLDTIPPGAGQVILLKCSNVSCEKQDLSNTTTGLTIYYSEHITIKNNVINSNNQNGIRVILSNNINISSNIICANVENGLLIEESNENIITYNNCSSNGASGIYDRGVSFKNYFLSNICNSNRVSGIYNQYTFENELIDNTCNSNTEFGIWIISSENNKIIRNDIVKSNETGLGIFFGIKNVVEQNTLSSNKVDGIYLKYSDSNFIKNNFISENFECGLALDFSDNNIFEFNRIFKNNYGFQLQKTNSNRFYHNNIIDNSIQTQTEMENFNHWNLSYPGGGNYWNNYNVLDEFQGINKNINGRDGFGDTNYIIDDTNIDYFPLMKPFGNLSSAPCALNANAGYGFVHLVWEPPLTEGSFPPHNYRIYRSEDNQNYYLVNEIENILTFNDTQVNNGLKYYYKISAKHPVGEGELSNAVEILVGGKPSVPVNITFDFEYYWTGDSMTAYPCGTSGKYNIINLNLTWDPPESDGGIEITGYNVYKGWNSANLSLFAQVKDNIFHVDTNLSRGAVLYYQICAVNPKGEGAKSEIFEVTVPSHPGKPLNPKAVPGELFINLSWDPPIYDGGHPLSGYNIFRKSGEGNWYYYYCNLKNRLFFNDTNVTAGINYSYKIQAINFLGPGTYSDFINATPLEKTMTYHNVLPVATIIVNDTNGIVPFTIHFVGSGYDSDGWIDSYYWDLGDGNYSILQNVTHTYYHVGIYEIILTVTDNRGEPGRAKLIVYVDDDIDKKITDEETEKNDDDWSFFAVITIICGLIIIFIILMSTPSLWQRLRVRDKFRKTRHMEVIKRTKRSRPEEEEEE